MRVMRRIAMTGILVTLSILLAVSSGMADDPELRWMPGAIMIDGRTDDWNNVPMTYFKDEEVSVGLTNDSSHLYILVRTGRPAVARLMCTTGLTLYLDGEGDKERDFKLTVRGGARPGFAGREPEGFRGGMMERPREEDETVRLRFSCYIKDRIQEKEIPVDGGEGPAVAVDTSYGMLAYEFAVPLRKAEVRNYGLGGILGTKVAVGLVWGEMDRADAPRPGGRPDGMGGGPPAGGMGGGLGGRGGMPAGGMERRKMPEKQELWIKARLASEPEERVEGATTE